MITALKITTSMWLTCSFTLARLPDGVLSFWGFIRGAGDRQMDWCGFSSRAGTVPGPLLWRKKLSQKAKLSIYESISVPTLTVSFGLWPKEQDCGYKQLKGLSAAGVAGLSRKDRIRSSDKAASPSRRKNQLRWFGHVVKLLPVRPPIGCHRQTGDFGYWYRTCWRVYIYFRPGECRSHHCEGTSGLPCLTYCHRNPDLRWAAGNGWTDGQTGGRVEELKNHVVSWTLLHKKMNTVSFCSFVCFFFFTQINKNKYLKPGTRVNTTAPQSWKTFL